MLILKQTKAWWEKVEEDSLKLLNQDNPQLFLQ